jgi:hypothetical protein
MTKLSLSPSLSLLMTEEVGGEYADSSLFLESLQLTAIHNLT